MFGDLQVEIAALKMIGNILKLSGWTIAIEESDVASSGTADSFTNDLNVAKTCRVCQVITCILYNLMMQAFSKDTGIWFLKLSC